MLTWSLKDGVSNIIVLIDWSSCQPAVGPQALVFLVGTVCCGTVDASQWVLKLSKWGDLLLCDGLGD